jgi:hypothetical protein
MTRHTCAIAALLIGCGGDDTTGTNADSGAVDVFDEIINVTDTATGVNDCFAPGDAWLTATADPACVQEVAFTGEVIDFESDNEVPEATVEIFNSDKVEGAADHSFTSDDNGQVAGTLTTCEPYSYKVTTDNETADDPTKITIAAHLTENPTALESVEFNSVSDATYTVIQALLGISPDPANGVVAGAIYDCNEDPIEGAQVIVKMDGGYVAGQEVRYFVEDFPHREQPYTSEDGLWLAMQVPTGRATVEAYMVMETGGEPQLMGSTSLDIFPDIINISSIYVGHDDGVLIDAECLTPTCGADTDSDADTDADADSDTGS